MGLTVKLGRVLHNQLVSRGNSAWDQFVKWNGEAWEGQAYINIAKSDNQKKMAVQFWILWYSGIPDKVRYNIYRFGDGSEVRSASRECTHVYDLSTKDAWLTESGEIPGKPGVYGRWTIAKTVYMTVAGEISDPYDNVVIYLPD